MTSEQSAQWKDAIEPLDYLDFHAVTLAGLQETAQRLASWGAPGWAIQLRESLIDLPTSPVMILQQRDEVDLKMWHPRFALRSEVALIGIQIFYPSTYELEVVYSRVLARFALEALRPFVEYAQTTSPALQEGYRQVMELTSFFEWLLMPPPKDFPDLPHFPLMSIDYSSPESMEIYGARRMGNYLLQEVCSILGFREEATRHTWTSLRTVSIKVLIGNFNSQHRWRAGGLGGEVREDVSSYAELVADAFLVALESECPPPDWLEQESL
ncbi:MAG: hypothetical protein QM758_06600 [Armatimonas sp.]